MEALLVLVCIFLICALLAYHRQERELGHEGVPFLGPLFDVMLSAHNNSGTFTVKKKETPKATESKPEKEATSSEMSTAQLLRRSPLSVKTAHQEPKTAEPELATASPNPETAVEKAPNVKKRVLVFREPSQIRQGQKQTH